MATIKYGTLELIPAPELGITLESKFFGADIRFSRTRAYTLKGTLLSRQLSGISGIATLQNDIITGFQSDYQPFNVNGTIIGYPKVNSISFDNGTLVQKNGYSIDLELLESGNPFQFTGVNYGFTGVTGLFYNIESLSESLNYDTDFRKVSYTHNVEIQYRTGFNIDPLLNAKLIASGLINNKSVYPFITTGSVFGQKAYEERTDVFGGTYGITEKFESPTGTSGFSHLYSLQLNAQENGFTTVAQQGTIQGYDPLKYENAKSGYISVRADIYNNCNTFYLTQCTNTLNNTYLTDSRADDINNGVISYARSFSDESGVLSGVRWQYTHQITKDDIYINASERGVVQGLGHASIHFAQSSGAYLSIRPGISGRTKDAVLGYGFTPAVFNEYGRTQEFNRFNGTISYDYNYSTNISVGPASGIRKFTTTIDDRLPVSNKVNFTVPNVAEIIQELGSTSAGERTVNVDAFGFRETATGVVLTFIGTQINLYAPQPIGDSFISPFFTNLQISYSLNENTARGTAGWKYGGNKFGKPNKKLDVFI